MKQICLLIITSVLISACGQSAEEAKRISDQEKAKLRTEDSLALKIAVMPTLDCLPIFVAKDARLFDTLGIDVRPRMFTAQMDCDTALAGGSVEGGISDLVRAQKLNLSGTTLTFVTATACSWQLITNKQARLKDIKQFEDKMLAITRYSATDLLSDMVISNAKIKSEKVYHPQINDVKIRLNMILNNEMDAVFLSEPQATVARNAGHIVLMDTKKKDINLGVLVFREKDMSDKYRQRQLKLFLKAYNSAVDSINNKGIEHYASIIKHYYSIDDAAIQSLSDFKFEHYKAPRQKDIRMASVWLAEKGFK